MTADDTAVLHLPGGDQELPIKAATEGSSALDIGKLLSGDRLHHLDPGFVNTASCTSAITYIDGDAGILRYRGYPIEQLAEHSTLPRGLLPADLRRAADRGRSSTTSPTRSAAHTLLHEDLKRVLRRVPARRAPDAGAVVGGRARCRPSTRTASTRSTREQVELSTVRLLAKLPTIAAYAYKKSIGQPFLYPDNSRASSRTSCA